MSGYFADPDVTPEESAAALDRLAAEYGVAEDVAAIREAGQNGAMDLVSFLRARLDEDEGRARAVQREREASAWPELDPWRLSWHDEYDLLCIEPSRALAEVEAKERLIKSHYDYRGVCTRCFDWQNKPVEREPFPCEVIRLLALPYADHPDYREEWKP